MSCREEISSKDEMIANLLKKKLADGAVAVTDIEASFLEIGITKRTLKRLKKLIGIKSTRSGGIWYWELQKSD